MCNTKSAVIITGHGEFAAGFQSALQLLIGETENTYFVHFNDAFDAYQEKMHTLVSELSPKHKEIIIFTDLAGGSPFNISSLLTKSFTNLHVIAGTNLPMVIDTITTLQYNLGEPTPESILETGKESVTAFAPAKAKVQMEEDGI